MGERREVPVYCYQCVAGPDLMKVEVEDGVATRISSNFDIRDEHPGAFFPMEKLVMSDDTAIVINRMWQMPEGVTDRAEAEPVGSPMVLVLGIHDGQIDERTLYFLAE